MKYKCISLTAQTIPSTAKQNPGGTYFLAQYLPIDNDTDIRVVKVNIFPTTPEVMAIYQEKVDNNKLLMNKEFDRVYVELPDYRMKDNDGNWRPKTYNGMEVCVEMKKNMQYIEGKSAQWLPMEDPKNKAIQTIERLGQFIAKSTHEESEVVSAPVAETAPAPVV